MRSELRGALPALIASEEMLERKAAARGVRYVVARFGGVRSQADTLLILGYRKADYAVYLKNLAAKSPGAAPIPIERWRKIAPFGNSKHNYGAAFDATIVEVAGVKLDSKASIWKSDPARARRLVQQGHDVLDELAPSCGLVSGDSFGDEPHFELPVSLATLRANWLALGGKPGVPLAVAGGVAVLAIVAAVGWLATRGVRLT